LKAEAIRPRVVAILEKMGKTDVPLDVDLVSSGILDSLDFLELVSSLEGEFKIKVDFSVLDPEQFTTLDGLVAALEGALQHSA